MQLFSQVESDYTHYLCFAVICQQPIAQRLAYQWTPNQSVALSVDDLRAVVCSEIRMRVTARARSTNSWGPVFLVVTPTDTEPPRRIFSSSRASREACATRLGSPQWCISHDPHGESSSRHPRPTVTRNYVR